MLFAVLGLASINVSPGSIPPRASDYAALDRGEVIKRVEPVKGAAVARVRAYIVIDAPPQKMFALIDQCNDYIKIMPRMTYSKELQRQGNRVTCKVKIKLPYFLGTLESVTQGIHTVGPPTWGRAWTLVSGNYKRNVGRWNLTAYKGNPNKTLVEYVLHGVPDLAIPDMLLRKANGRAIPGMLRDFRKRLTGKSTR